MLYSAAPDRTPPFSATGTGWPTGRARSTSSPPGTPLCGTAGVTSGPRTSLLSTATTSPRGVASRSCSPCATWFSSPAPLRRAGDRPELAAALRQRLDGVLFFFNDTATTAIYTLSLHDALPLS